MANFKIALTAGHDKYNPKRCAKALDPNETREWVLNDRIADKVEKLLKSYTGYELLRTDDTTGEPTVPLEERTKKANEWGADFYLSIHHNAAEYIFDGGGITVYVRRNPLAESVEGQEELSDALIEETGLKGDRATPLARSNLHEVYVPEMPSVLLELGFMNSRSDVPVILTEEFADQCARAIVKVLARRGNLTKISDTEEPVKANSLYKVKNEIIIADPAKVKTTGDGIFTIVEEKAANGILFGRLKSGAGWVQLTHAKKM